MNKELEVQNPAGIFERSYVAIYKRLNVHVLGVVGANTAGAALNIATGSVSNTCLEWAIYCFVISTVASLFLFISRTNLDNEINNDNSPDRFDVKFNRFCDYDRSDKIIYFFIKLLVFLVSLVIAFTFAHRGTIMSDTKEEEEKLALIYNLDSMRTEYIKQHKLLIDMDAEIKKCQQNSTRKKKSDSIAKIKLKGM